MKIRVLIFDDEDSVRGLLCKIVALKNYETFDYRNPSECFIYADDKCECKQSQCADIIITDVEMPVVNGISFINHLLSKECKANNILIVSGCEDYKTLEEVSDKKIKFLKKPFSIHAVLSILDEFEKNIDPSRTLIDFNT
jgi:DNA-binding NtrC family response regulator